MQSEESLLDSEVEAGELEWNRITRFARRIQFFKLDKNSQIPFEACKNFLKWQADENAHAVLFPKLRVLSFLVACNSGFVWPIILEQEAEENTAEVESLFASLGIAVGQPAGPPLLPLPNPVGVQVPPMPPQLGAAPPPATFPLPAPNGANIAPPQLAPAVAPPAVLAGPPPQMPPPPPPAGLPPVPPHLAQQIAGILTTGRISDPSDPSMEPADCEDVKDTYSALLSALIGPSLESLNLEIEWKQFTAPKHISRMLNTIATRCVNLKTLIISTPLLSRPLPLHIPGGPSLSHGQEQDEPLYHRALLECVHALPNLKRLDVKPSIPPAFLLELLAAKHFEYLNMKFIASHVELAAPKDSGPRQVDYQSVGHLKLLCSPAKYATLTHLLCTQIQVKDLTLILSSGMGLGPSEDEELMDNPDFFRDLISIVDPDHILSVNILFPEHHRASRNSSTLYSQHFAGLTSCTKLQTLQLNANQLSLNDEDLLLMTQSWPHMRTLHLDNWSPEGGITYVGLVGILRNCPLLDVLTVRWDATNLPSEAELEDFGSFSAGFICVFSGSPINDASLVAKVLGKLTPHLRGVDVAYSQSALRGNQDPVAERVVPLWREVGRIIGGSWLAKLAERDGET